MNRAMRWWVLAFLSAVVLLGSAAGLWWSQRPKRPPSWVAPISRPRCPDVDAPIPALAAQTIPVLLFSGGKVRLAIDDLPTLSPLEDPRRFAPGEYTLRAEGEGSSLALTFHLEPFVPAMFHVEETVGLGLTLVYLGARCVSCPPPGRVGLQFTRTSTSDQALLEEAAKALRTADWPSAGARLRGVSPKSRSGPAFGRLAANVYQSSGQSERARAQLEKGHRLDDALQTWSALSKRESARKGSAGLQRWNLLTQKFSTLLERFAAEAPGPVQLATSRLSELSTGFLEASHSKDSLAQDETVGAAEAALEQLVRALRRSRPQDCEFQARISASL